MIPESGQRYDASGRGSDRGHSQVVIRARGVRFSYGATEVLKTIDLDVRPGEVMALLGPSGSGKSTLLYCLAGILVPQSGSILFRNYDLVTLKDKKRTWIRRRHFGFVLQFGRLVADLTAVENVSFPLRLNGMRRSRAEKLARYALETVGLDQIDSRRTATMSGGEQQRAAVARALIHRPSVIFADEPTGALDSKNGEIVIEVLESLARKQGAAVILVTHDESLATRADRVIRLRDGVIVEETLRESQVLL